MTNFTGGSNNNNNNPNPPAANGVPFINGIPIGSPPQQNDTDISEFTINYNQKFKTAGKTLFRDSVIQQTLAVLIGKNKPNALLVGAAGTGKTKIVEDIAYRIESGDPLIPDKLKGYTIYELILSSLVANTGIVGQLEEKVSGMLKFMSDPKNKAIVFIDEIHMLSSGSETYAKIAQMLKPALARGDIKTIGATTLQESTELMKDPAFNRRFSRVPVDELTRPQTVEILKQCRAGFYIHYQNRVQFSDDTIETCAILADNYKKAGSHRPDNAITLLDRALADAVIRRKVMEENAKNDPNLLQAIQANPMINLTERQLKATAVKLMTGSAEKDSLDKDALAQSLSRIKGQDESINKIVDLLVKDDMNLFPRKQPLTLLFAGTSGVGKTEVTKIIAEELTGLKPIILNMTEYNSEAAINRIIGAPPGYVGYNSHSESVFDILESNPYQVILLDEFEKCDKAVQRLFMSAFEEGYIETSKGTVIDFSKAIIVATTNASYTKKSVGFGETDRTAPSKQVMIQCLSKWFDRELLGRFKEILTFNTLDKDAYREIAADIYRKEAARINAEHRRINLPADIPDDDLDKIVAETYVPELGARPARPNVQRYIEEHV